MFESDVFRQSSIFSPDIIMTCIVFVYEHLYEHLFGEVIIVNIIYLARYSLELSI